MSTDFFKFFILEIRQKIPKHNATADILADLLGLTKGSIYKKINGEVNFSIAETLQLAAHFNISIDAFLHQQSNKVIFDYPVLNEESNEPFRFLMGIYHDLEKLKKATHFRILYATNEIPVFYYLFFPELTAFKSWVWHRTTWKTASSEFVFSENGQAWIQHLIENQKFQLLRKSLMHSVLTTPSLEFYPVHLLDNTISQIKLMYDLGEITPDFVHTLREQIDQICHWWYRASLHGRKPLEQENNGSASGAPIQIYFNEIMYTNNVILAEADGVKQLYITIDNPNFIASTDERMTRHMTGWFEKLKNKSVSLNDGGDKQRKYFFNELQKRLLLLDVGIPKSA